MEYYSFVNAHKAKKELDSLKIENKYIHVTLGIKEANTITNIQESDESGDERRDRQVDGLSDR